MTKRILYRTTPLLLSTVLLAAGSALSAAPAVANDGESQSAANYSSAATPSGPIAQLPPMGFNNWSRSTCAPQAPLDGSNRLAYSFQQYMQDNAKGLYDTGLIAAGYKTITVDDCWMYRNSSGYLHGALNWGGATDVRDTTRQPGFDHELTAYGDYLHSLGAKFGIYETSGTHTCSTATPTAPNLPNGSEYYEQNDANSFVYWGVDALKYDNCGQQEPMQTLDARMANDLRTAVTNAANSGNATPNVMFNISAPAAYANGSTKFAVMNWVRSLGQLWRVGPDIWNYGDGKNPWNVPLAGYNFGAYQSFDNTLELSRYQGPGNWNDADMLLIGDNGMTTAEERSQMSLFSALAAPLVISTDARKFEPSYIASHPAEAAHLNASIGILGNSEVIAVDQDPLGAGGYRVAGGAANADGTPAATSGFDVVVKPLADGSRAVVVLNKGGTSAGYTLNLSSIGFNTSGCGYTVRDLWAHATSSSTGSVPLTIGSHDSAMLKVTPQNGCGGFTPRGQITVSRDNWGKASLCLDNYQSGTGTNNPVDVYPCSGTSNQQWQMNGDGSVQLLQAGTSNLCLTAQSGQTAGVINGQQGQWAGVAPCGSAPGYQTWTYNRDGNLKLAGTAKCLDVYSGKTTTNGTPVDLYTCGTSPNAIQTNQAWAAPFSTPPGA
ncbi:ricin-type beta-trefoil lectin domain protein [Kitasatospora atroaurantiaca]|uniref:Alpha-galactosidase n=1 Tax=Kitasatospora atroaurantiaca TaxID=285545 RepID=A0A561EJT6_9ACTN|nr:alpha-galactosidase [Kitasatospora atroaurantiaca]TWE15860.1 alpha-galactosidase [Kitasatospora atroaurantiaca]